MSKTSAKTVAIVQARLGSTRLPMKSLLCLRDVPLIDWVTRRLSRAAKLDGIMLAVPDTEQDVVLLDHARRHGLPCTAGPEEDVLARMLLAAKAADAAFVVRVCADNPLIWGEAVDRLLEHYAGVVCDYAYNHIPRGNLWPDGLGAEVLSRDLLEDVASKAAFPSQREHCLNYIWDNAEQFRISTFDPIESWLQRPDIKLDIDSPEDFRKLALLPLHPDMDAREIVRVFSRT
ncbi:MAG: NTP transferase domain-containing protein [Desulfovibrio sp.]|jgi:spore coat polysaccharide biosynthesis protein SpsF|nr:NTP transferase domain-containing protein [Desulfovibrio sp.]